MLDGARNHPFTLKAASNNNSELRIVTLSMVY